MKVTSNLSFLLCITSVVMPVVDARANGFGLNKRSSAMKSPATKAYDFSAHQQRRGLQTDDDAAFDEMCETILAVVLGTTDSGCTCSEAEPTDECVNFLTSCNICDTLEGEKTCRSLNVEASAAASSADVFAECSTYESGLFGNTICLLDNEDDGSCTITIDGTECNSCAPVTCDGEFIDDGFDFDCSNIIEGETWNLCTDDIPETSRFLAFGNNDRFTTVSDCDGASGGGGSGGFALSLHALSVVGLMVVATFW
jgi:hypothetical protein